MKECPLITNTLQNMSIAKVKYNARNMPSYARSSDSLLSNLTLKQHQVLLSHSPSCAALPCSKVLHVFWYIGTLLSNL